LRPAPPWKATGLPSMRRWCADQGEIILAGIEAGVDFGLTVSCYQAAYRGRLRVSAMHAVSAAPDLPRPGSMIPRRYRQHALNVDGNACHLVALVIVCGFVSGADIRRGCAENRFLHHEDAVSMSSTWAIGAAAHVASGDRRGDCRRQRARPCGLVDLSRSAYRHRAGRGWPTSSAACCSASGIRWPSGCGSRSLIRIGGGNLNPWSPCSSSLLAAEMTLRGLLSPVRTEVLGALASSSIRDKTFPGFCRGAGIGKRSVQPWIAAGFFH